MVDTVYIEGELITLRETFLDDFEEPLEPANTESGVYVAIFRDKNVVMQGIAVRDANGVPGDWVVSFTLPKMGIESRIAVTAVFELNADDRSTHKSRQKFFIDPAEERRATDIIFVIGSGSELEFSIPQEYTAPVAQIPANVGTGTPAVPAVVGDELLVSLFHDNRPLYGEPRPPLPEWNIRASKRIGKTTIRCPMILAKNVFEPYQLMCTFRHDEDMLPLTYTFNVWPATPTILSAAAMLEDQINKARAANSIPELEWTQADLLQFLYRGLSMFNAYPPHITAFTGTNMKGVLLDAWLLCSAYYALDAQLQAEGQMAFDFSGQTTQLNVDRTPAIESAIGRLESAIQDRLKPLKVLLAQNGATGGDGSVGGGPISNPYQLGTLGLGHHPVANTRKVTRTGWWGGAL